MDRTLKLLIEVALKNQRSLQSLAADLGKIQQLSKVEFQPRGLDQLAKGLADGQQQARKLLGAVSDLTKANADRLVRQVNALGKASEGSSRQFQGIGSAIAQAQKQLDGLAAIAKRGIGVAASVRDVGRLADALQVSRESAKQLAGALELPASDIIKATELIRQMSVSGQPLAVVFEDIGKKIGVAREGVEQLYLAMSRPPAPPALPEPPPPPEAPDEALAVFAELADVVGVATEAVVDLAEELDLPVEAIAEATAQMRRLAAAGVPVEDRLESLQSAFGLTQRQFEQLRGQFSQGGERARISFTELASSVFLVQQAVGALQATLQPAYQALIGANEQLNQQLLSSAATITATSRVSQDGQLLVDPTETIKALQGPLKDAIKEVEIATRELVGVTSEDVNTAFSSVLQNISQLNGQLNDAATGAQKFATPIEAATALAPGLVATLGTLGLPLEQAADEINNLLKGEIDQTAQLAKSLNISREQIEQWKEQGVLVDRLVERFNPFIEANAIAARSVAGISSNIQDIIQVIGRTSGEPLVEPFVRGLEITYQLLQQNQEAIQQLFQRAIGIGIKAGESVVKAFEPLAKSLLEVAGDAGPIALSVLESVATAVQLVATAAGPLVSVIGKILELVTGLAATDLGGLVLQATLLTTALVATSKTITAQLIPALARALPASLAATAKAMAATTAQTLAMQGGFLAASKAAIPALIAGFKALIPAAAAAVAALGPILAPLAVLGAGVAIAITVRKSNDIKNTQQELDSLLGSTNALADESLNYAAKLKALNDIEAENGKLTEEQEKKRQRLSAIARDNAVAIQDQITALKDIEPANEAQANQINTQIALLEQRLDLLGRNSQGLQIEGAALEELGTSYEQLEAKIRAANEAIRQEGSGDKVRFDEQVQQLQELTLRQFELGQITRDVAEERLQAIISNEKVGFEAQLAASEAIEQLRQQELSRQQQRTDAEIGLIEASSQGRVAAEIEAAQKISALREQQLQERIDSNREAIARERQEIEQGVGSEEALGQLLAEEKQLQAERIQLRDSTAQQLNQIQQEESDRRRQILEAEIAAIDLEVAKGSKSQIAAAEETAQRRREILQTQLEDTERAIAQQQQLLSEGSGDEGELRSLLAQQRQIQTQIEQQAIDGARAITDARIAEAERANIAIEASELQAQLRIAQLRADGSKSAIELEADQLRASQERIQAQIRLEEEKLAELRRQQGPQTQQTLDAIAQQENQIAQLRIQAEEQRQAAREQALQKELAAIDRRGAAIEQAEAETALEIARIRDDGTADQLERDRIQLQSTVERVEAELRLEEEKLNQLRRQPQNQDILDQIQRQETAVTRLRAQAIEERIRLEEQEAQAAIEILDRRQRQAIALIEETEAERAVLLQQRENELRARGVAESEIEKERAATELTQQRDTLSQRLDAQREYLRALEALPQPDDPDRVRERENQIRSAKIETARLTEQLLVNQEAQQRRLTEQALSDIDKQQRARERAAQAATGAIEREQQLLNARNGLAESAVRVEEARLRAQAAGTDDAVKKSRIELQIAELQQSSLQQRQATERKSLELTQRRALIENQIAIASAKAELAKARARGATQEELEALQQIIQDTTSLRSTLLQAQRIERQTLRNNQEADSISTRSGVDQARRSLRETRQQQQEDGQENNRDRSSRGSTSSVRRGGVNQRTTSTRRRDSEPSDPGGADRQPSQSTPELQALAEATKNLTEKQKTLTEETDKGTTATQQAAGAFNNVADAAGDSIEAQARLANAANQAARRLSAIPAVAARKDGGPVEKGGVYAIAEVMPELLVSRDGKARLVTEPQLFRADEDGHVIDGNTTRRMLRQAYSPLYATASPPGGAQDVVWELRQLRSLIQHRPPVRMEGDTINVGAMDLPKAMDIQAMRQRSLLRAGGLF